MNLSVQPGRHRLADDLAAAACPMVRIASDTTDTALTRVAQTWNRATQ
jgi:hypothetical protein